MAVPHVPRWLREEIAARGAQWLNKDISASEADDLVADVIQKRHDSGDPYGRAVWLAVARKERTSWWKTVKHQEAERQTEQFISGIVQEPLFELPFPLLGGEVSVGFGRMVPQLDLDYATALAARNVRANQQQTVNKAHDEYLAEMDRLLAILDQDHAKKLADFIDEPGSDAGAL